MSLQLFVWVGPGQVKDNKIHYKSFTLNSHTYNVGDCVYLYPEDEQYPPYIARILAAFVDKDVQAGIDPHCIEVKWFERRVNLEPSTKGIEESEREVFELEDTDVNPIGCISGKCRIVKASCYDEALQLCGKTAGWYFCRGYFQQSTNSFVAYTPTEIAPFGGVDAGRGPLPAGAMEVLAPGGLQPPQPRGILASHAANNAQTQELPVQPPQVMVESGPGLAVTAPPFPNGLADVGEDADEPPTNLGRRYAGSMQQQPQLLNPPPVQQQPASKRQKATGRTCLECGTTTTPQWREGPMGPKTLCNACGVRYVRSQQKAAGQKRSSGGVKNGQGRPKELTPPRAQQVDRVTKRGTSQKAYLNAPPTNDPTSVSASNSV